MKKVDMFILNEVMKNHALKTKSRWQPLVWKRYALFNFLRSNNFTLSFIGDLVNRDHATVINGLKGYNELKRYKDFQAIVHEIEDDLKACIVVDIEEFPMREVSALVSLENLIAERL